ncbi:MAG: galactose ABC transporter substrate-binding protein [Spirochaetia bacterium]
MAKKMLVVTFVALALIACGNSAGKARGSRASIGFAVYKYDDTFMSGVRRAVEGAAEGRAMVLTQDSQNQQATQNDLVDNFLTQGVDALIVNPVDRTAAAVLISKARSRDVPIVFINREPEVSDIESWERVYYVGAKAADSGVMSTEILIDYFNANKGADLNGDGVVQYVVLTGEPGHQDAVLRTQAYTDTFASSRASGGLAGQELMRDTGMWDRGRAQEKMAAMLAAFPGRIEAVLANNDDMALGAIEALKQAGYFTPNGKFMPVIGIDATAPGLDAIENGTLLGTVLNDAVSQGTDALNVAVALVNGEDPANGVSAALTGADGTGSGRYVWVPYRKVTKENYRNFLQK